MLQVRERPGLGSSAGEQAALGFRGHAHMHVAIIKFIINRTLSAYKLPHIMRDVAKINCNISR